MPFQSEKQRKYLWANEPAIARDWTDKYGSRVKKQEGGFTGTWIPGYTKPINLDPYIYPKAHEQKYLTRKDWATSPNMYHNEIMNDYVTNVSKNLSGIPYAGNFLAGAAELGAPIASGILSLPYDLKQAVDDWQTKDYNSVGDTFKGLLRAIDHQNPLDSVYHRTKGSLRPLGRRLENTWDAIKNEFGGSAQAADLSGMIPKNLEKTIEEGMQSYKKSNEISPALRKAIEEGTSYNEWDRIPNEKYHGLPIQRISLNQDEDDPYALTERLMRRGDFRPSSSYPSYNAWQMRAAQAPGLKRNIGRVMDFLRGPGTRLTPAQQRANQNYMTQHRITRNPQTGRMQGGLFAGQNAPGTSYFGSKTFQEMANKNIQKWGKTAPQAKVDAWKAVVTGGRDPSQGSSYTGHGKSGMGRDKSQLMAQGGLASLWQR